MRKRSFQTTKTAINHKPHRLINGPWSLSTHLFLSLPYSLCLHTWSLGVVQKDYRIKYTLIHTHPARPCPQNTWGLMRYRTLPVTGDVWSCLSQVSALCSGVRMVRCHLLRQRSHDRSRSHNISVLASCQSSLTPLHHSSYHLLWL